MSAAQSKPPEPSMEEILASIRRIISDDQTALPGSAPAAAAPPLAEVRPAVAAVPLRASAAEDDDDVLDLAPRKPVARKPEPHLINDDPVANDLAFEDMSHQAPQGQGDIDALMAAAEMAPEPPPEFQPELAPQPERLISPTTDRMVSTAFSSLANTVLANNARTLDDLVQDMLRPMIKSWLDDNLPSVVERLVRAEIERVARGGR